jgi:Fe-S oxidoreductase
LHTRQLFDLKSPDGRKMFRDIATDVAALVKKYRGSLSGEHGDGRLRGEFIPFMVGPECYAMMRRVKALFDPLGIFNPGKIIDTPPMDGSLRHAVASASVPEPTHKTFFNFDADHGVLRAAEKCTGVGECRKTHLSGGTMCPSYMATHDEKDSTRARANLLRQALGRTGADARANPWDDASVAAVMDLCLSCKACKSECPSSVDLARLKAEWLQHYHDAHGVPLRSRLVAGFARSMRVASLAPSLYNRLVSTPFFANALKRLAGFATERSLPALHATTLAAWHRRHANPPHLSYPHGRVFLFCDEFTNYGDTPVGIQAVELLNRLGYEVLIPEHGESARAHLSKGLVRDAAKLAARNVELLAPVVSDAAPLIGIEPSALLGFRDEYPDLVPEPLRPAARALARRVWLIDEFIAREADAGRIRPESFAARELTIKLHGHCHQKSLSSLTPTVKMLELPRGHSVRLIPSGCCGMAGSFGYEREHYEMSRRVGELVLFPAVRATPEEVVIAAPGTSCRHQIMDGTGRLARHPIELLHSACKGLGA